MSPILLLLFLVTCSFFRVEAVTYNATLLHPVAGDVVYAGQPYTVTWTVDTSFTTLNLFVLGDDYNDQIVHNINNTGSYIWNVETYWPSTSSLYMVLNRADWNTNDEISPFRMISVQDQTGVSELVITVTSASPIAVTKTVSIITGCPSTTAIPSATVTYTPSACPQFTPPAVGTAAGTFFLGVIFGIVFGAVLVKQASKPKRGSVAAILEKDKYKSQRNGAIPENRRNGESVAGRGNIVQQLSGNRVENGTLESRGSIVV